MSIRGVISKLGSVLIVAGILGIGALVAWNVFGQAKLGSECEHSLGCRSYYCVHHELAGTQQVHAPHGMCTRSCETDADCKDAGATCVVLGDEARDDLPPFGKPDKACLRAAKSP